MRSKTLRPFILSITAIIFLLSILQVTSAYFNPIKKNFENGFEIGDWLEYIPDEEYIQDYLLEEIFEEDPTTADFILNTIGSVDSNDEFTVSETFEDYTMKEIIEVAKLIEEFMENFLDEDNKFPTKNKPGLSEVNVKEGLLPGEVVYLKQVFVLANYRRLGQNDPLTIQIALELPGVDLSDFYIEVLVDKMPLDENRPFAYEADLRYNNQNIGNVKRNKNSENLTLIGGSINYTTRNNQVNLNYYHNIPKPDSTGYWHRFTVGDDYAINTSGNIITSSQGQRQGLKLIGSPNGARVILNFHLTFRTPRSGIDLPIIPLTLAVSRGVKQDINGNPLEQSTERIKPIISTRIVDGEIKDNKIN